jgi:glycosyltransferase involved in cell wall biosynthesis
VMLYALFQRNVVFYTRDEFIALCLWLLGKKVVWEGHTGQRNLVVRAIIALRVPLVLITTALKDLYASFGVKAERMLVAPDGADITRFNIAITQQEARTELGLPLDKTIVLYKGHLYEQKGAHTVARAASLLRDIDLVFIGGNEPDVEAFTKEFGGYENVKILGNKPRKETPIYQKAADFLVIPNSAKDDVSKLYTSPMKLFGYMASGVPIIASDLPSLREILNDSLAYFFTPDSPESFAQALTQAAASPQEAKRKGEATLALASEHSWQKRAQSIMDFMKLSA